MCSSETFAKHDLRNWTTVESKAVTGNTSGATAFDLNQSHT